ncbi:hypothetical protein VUR80DRAFT_9760 [Thermomyces stellatus]
MSPAAPPRWALRVLLAILVPVALASTTYLYLYPLFHSCAFPLPPPHGADPRTPVLDAASRHAPLLNATVPRAPFRLLALGDPQLEGDTSIPNKYLGVVPHLKSLYRHLTFKTSHPSLRQRLRRACHDLVDFYFEDIPNELESLRKRVDLLGNDFYLAHVYRTLSWWAQPTHVSVLGDLVGSQWIGDREFERRGRRFWDRVFRGAERVPDDLAAYPAHEYDLAAFLDGSDPGLDAWRRRLINVPGNHDIGYAGDLTPERLARFERVFGRANYELRFELPVSDPAVNATLYDPATNPESRRLMPELRVVVFNNMNLDTPAVSKELQDETYQFMNAVIKTGAAVEFRGHFTVALTHIPLHKEAGVCVDAPYFDFFPADEGGGLREQYMLSEDASRGFLEGIYGLNKNPRAPGRGMGRRGVILNGHDHAGCDTWHFVNQTNGTAPAERRWEARRWAEAEREGIPGREGHPGIREITVRSMMGDFEGSAGLLSAWFDEEAWEWRVEYAACELGPHYMWWAIHVVDLVTAVGIVIYGVTGVFGAGDKAVGEGRDGKRAAGASAGGKKKGVLR